MPVHAPRPRVYSSVPFKHLAQASSMGGRSSNIYLNVTPFVDMMTILVTFLLMVFSTTGELTLPADVKLPKATNQQEVRRATLVGVSASKITLGTGKSEKVVIDFRDFQDDGLPYFPLLIEKLTEERDARIIRVEKGAKGVTKKDRENCEDARDEPSKAFLCPYNVAVLLADKEVEAKTMNKVITSIQQAKFVNIQPAVVQRSD